MTNIPGLYELNPSAATPAALLSYQQSWVADKSALKVFEKSRRTGITWAEASDNVLTAASNRSAGGQNVYYIAYNLDMTVEYIQACAMWARVFNYAATEVEEGFWEDEDDEKHIKTFTIRFPESGFRIVALSSKPSSLRGRQGVVVVDEAAFHDQLGELLKAAMALLIWGGKVRIISTHNGEDNPFNDLIKEIRADKRSGSVHRVTFREAIAQGLYRRVCLRLGNEWTQAGENEWTANVYKAYGDDAIEELDCVPRNSGGTWLSRALVELRMSAETPVLRYVCATGFELLSDKHRYDETQEWLEDNVKPHLEKIPNDAMTFFGEDFGRTGDLTVLTPLVQTQGLVRRPPFVVELRNVPFKQQEQIVFYIIDRLPRFLGGAFDARGNGQYLAEVSMQRYGSMRISQVMLTESWYREHMPPLKAALEDGTLDGLPKDADILADLRLVEVIRGVPRIPDTRTTGKDDGKRHGDSAISIALAYYASRELNKGPVKATSRKNRYARKLLRGY